MRCWTNISANSVETFDEFTHLITECSNQFVKARRDKHLREGIARIRKSILDQLGLNNRLEEWHTLSALELNKQIAIYLLGGMLEERPIEWTLGFGHLEQLWPGQVKPGWAHVAEFLSQVAPSLYSKLYPKDGVGFFGTPMKGTAERCSSDTTDCSPTGRTDTHTSPGLSELGFDEYLDKLRREMLLDT